MKKTIITALTCLLIGASGANAQGNADAPFVIPSLHNWQAKSEATFNVYEIDNITYDYEEFRSAAILVQDRLLRRRDSVNVYSG